MKIGQTDKEKNIKNSFKIKIILEEEIVVNKKEI